MSDDEVLNLAGWGIPTRIVRTRKPGEWREEWVYAPPSEGGRRLRFVNAKLVDVDEAWANEQLALLTGTSRLQAQSRRIRASR